MKNKTLEALRLKRANNRLEKERTKQIEIVEKERTKQIEIVEKERTKQDNRLERERKQFERERKSELHYAIKAIEKRDVLKVDGEWAEDTWARCDRAASRIRWFHKRWGFSQELEDISNESIRRMNSAENMQREQTRQRHLQAAIELIEKRDVVIVDESRLKEHYRHEDASRAIRDYHDRYGFSKYLDKASINSRRKLHGVSKGNLPTEPRDDTTLEPSLSPYRGIEQ